MPSCVVKLWSAIAMVFRMPCWNKRCERFPSCARLEQQAPVFTRKVIAVADAEEHQLQIVPTVAPDFAQPFKGVARAGIEAHRRVERHVPDRRALTGFTKNVHMPVTSHRLFVRVAAGKNGRAIGE